MRMLPVLVLVGGCVCAMAIAQNSHPMHDSPPPQPMPPPTMVKSNPHPDLSQFRPTAKLPHVPSVNTAMREVLAEQRRVWAADAQVSSITFNWGPHTGASEYYELEFFLFSVKKNDTRFYKHGGIYNGSITGGGPASNLQAVQRIPLQYPATDLEHAIGIAREVGDPGPYFTIIMTMSGRTGTQPLQIWTFTSDTEAPSLHQPWAIQRLPISVQTGKVLPYLRVFDPEHGSDREMQEAWQALVNRMTPQQRKQDVESCADQIQGGQTSCYIPPN